ncbi:hypothetical protein F2P81_017033 [Scophthalmus maximus]|uniref:Uncharacterized protein n=1 Tax=Scophthalmus maximus TaxID=52904 RepID=A0A6A4SIY2_SCOMX|nr:hypothetical protein F2P81_017033 [Scophthalmus maximus]
MHRACVLFESTGYTNENGNARYMSRYAPILRCAKHNERSSYDWSLLNLMIYSALDTKKNVGLLSSLLFVTGDDPHDETENGSPKNSLTEPRALPQSRSLLSFMTFQVNSTCVCNSD